MRTSIRSPRAWHCAIVLIVFSRVPVLGDDRPFGIQARVPWNTSRLVGSPEPPSPYVVEKTFSKLTWNGPIYIAEEPGTDFLWVIQGGAPENGTRIVRVKDDPAATSTDVVLDLPNRLAYSVCFHPQYATNGIVYVFTNGPRNAAERKNKITRYIVDRKGVNPPTLKSGETVIEWKSAGHDGGDMAFGTDGMLYITTGDGTSDSDGWDSGQTLNDLLGSVLRIDVDHHDPGTMYSSPKDNPFVATPGARPEIWAYGLRNPWRMCVDPKSGQIWVGNNGQDLWETAHLIRRGENYGWSVQEGSHPFYLERRRGPTPIVPPTIEHPHSEFRSLTGGVVNRGDRLPDLDGAYIYGDHSSGRIWGMKHDGQEVIWHRELADTALQITAFRVDHRSELLIADYGGGIYRLAPRPNTEPVPPFPKLLSETGLFASTKEYTLERGALAYSVNAPGWNDGAVSDRFMAIPGESKVGFDSGRSWTFPDGTALVQTLSKEGTSEGPRSRLETRILLRQQGEWEGYSYRWNAEQTDATLVKKEGEDAEIIPGRTWRFPSRSECMACHSRAGNFVLGAAGSQLNRDHDYAGIRDNQLRTLEHIGLFTSALPKAIDRLVDPKDESKDIEVRARTYLHVNCSGCHVEAGGGNSKMELGIATPREKMSLIGARPQHDTFGLPDAMLIAPGQPDRSVLPKRISLRGRGQMPPLVTHRVDDEAVQLMRTWIAGLKPDRAFVREWTMDDLLPSMAEVKEGRSIDAGRKTFLEIGCNQCHRIGGEGGSVGPELAGVARRLDPRALLESVILPSKVIDDAYAVQLVEIDDGTVVSGRVEREDDRELVLRPLPSGESVKVEKARITARKKSDLSNMPKGTVNVLTKDQILDLMAYLISDPQPSKPGSR